MPAALPLISARRPWPAYLAALVAGVLATLSFAPFHLWWLGPIAVALVALDQHRLTLAQATLRGRQIAVALVGSGAPLVYAAVR